MSIHICTTESLQAGVDIPPSVCPFCKQHTLYAGWVSQDCRTCGASFCGEFNYTVRSVREGMKMTRKDLAGHAGLKPSTLKRYEWVWPSRRYFNWLLGFAAAHYNQAKPGMGT